MPKLPKITVITPSYNQSAFIGETIQSVIDQKYPNLEYMIFDGASTDGSQDVIEKYSSYLDYYISQKDGGQAQAINAGMQRATGDLICWLNSDDLYEPNTLNRVAEIYMNTQADFIYGDGFTFKDGSSFRKYIKPGSISLDKLCVCDPIQQPSTFWTRKVVDQIGLLNESMYFAFDWEFFIRVAHNFPMSYISLPFSSYRLHKDHKTGSNRLARSEELLRIVNAYAPQYWVNLYNELQPYTDEITRHKKNLRRFSTYYFCLAHPQLSSKFAFQDLKTVFRML